MPTALDILLVGATDSDRSAIRRACSSCMVHDVAESASALDFLLRQNGMERATRPDLLLLRWRAESRDLVDRIKSHAVLHVIPVIVLSSPADEALLRSCYELRTNAVIQTPVEEDRFHELLRHMERFWLNTAALPFRAEKARAAAGLPA